LVEALALEVIEANIGAGYGCFCRKQSSSSGGLTNSFQVEVKKVVELCLYELSTLRLF
jgi:hypothetical protein